MLLIKNFYFLLYLFLFSTPVLSQTAAVEVGEFLRNRIEAAGSPLLLCVEDDTIHASVMLPIFYEQRVFEPAWSSSRGLQAARELIDSIRRAGLEGLEPQDYHLQTIQSVLLRIEKEHQTETPYNPRRLVDLELLCTDAFLIYASHLLAGKVDPVKIDAEWFANRREADLARVLQQALDSGSLEGALNRLKPPQPEYKRLRLALQRYRQIKELGGWPFLTEGAKLEPGVQDNRIQELQRRLRLTGDLKGTGGDENVYNDSLQTAVRRFQMRHGLLVDGVVGPATLTALNVSVEERIRQIEINLERWRWLLQDLGKRHIRVNIADFNLQVIEDARSVITMRIIVGKDYRRTPVFSDRITYLVFCPYWHVPHNIAVQDILPAVRKDPAYLSSRNIEVFQGWGEQAVKINPDSVNWSQLTARTFQYRFRQKPGPENALGRVKFMFPNPFNVYLHDTPTRNLFNQTTRMFSSGCIRLEKPVELAEYVLRSNPNINLPGILKIIDKWQETTVRTPAPVPIHLLYWTSWADRDGTVHFRTDIYNRDMRLYNALRESP